MFKRLCEKWNVGPLRLVLILFVFAIGGSLTGITGKYLMKLLNIEPGAGYIIIYIIVMTLIWPCMVLAVSLPFGQFYFFKDYLKKMGKKISGRKYIGLFFVTLLEFA